MKNLILMLIYILFYTYGYSQTIYESPSGISFKIGTEWKEMNYEIFVKKLNELEPFVTTNEIRFDACFQKSEITDSFKLPYILFKTTLLKDYSIRDEMKMVLDSLVEEGNIQNVLNNVFIWETDFTLKHHDINVDTISNIIIYTLELGNDGFETYGIFGLCFEKNSLEQIYCYASKEQFYYKKELLDIIYSKNNFKNKNIILATNLFNNALELAKANNYRKAISLFSQAIENYPEKSKNLKAEAYYNRGVSKKFVNDLNGAFSDFSEAIKLQPDEYKSYNNRGWIKIQLKNYNGAIIDFNKTIEIDNYKTEFTGLAIGNRGIAKLMLKQDGCKDLLESIKLGNKGLIEIYNINCK